MCEENKKLENTELTDEQMENISGGLVYTHVDEANNTKTDINDEAYKGEKNGIYLN